MAPSADAGYAAAAKVEHKSSDVPSKGSALVLAMATAVPSNKILQSDYPDFYFNVTNSNDQIKLKQKFIRICQGSTIKERYFHMTEEILKANPSITTYLDPSLTARHEIAIAEVPKLAKEAAVKAIKEWGRPMSEITHLVFGTTNGVHMPGADQTLCKLLGLRNDVKRVMLYQVGCNGGASVMRLGKDLAENNKGARVLTVTSEIIYMQFRAPSADHMDGLVGAALFGDGAAALIIGSDPVPEVERPIYEIKGALESIVPNSDGAVTGSMVEAGMIFHLLRDVPELIASNIEKILMQARESAGSPPWNEMFWAVHPGGPAILQKIQDKLGLEDEKLGACRETLAHYGNMSSSTVLFVLDRIRQRSVEQGQANSGEGAKYGFLMGFGPGLTVEVLTLKSLPLTV